MSEKVLAEEEAVGKLKAERDEARQILRDIYWMALRYADGRMSYAPGMVNDAVKKGYDAGWLDPNPPNTPKFARLRSEIESGIAREKV